MGVLPLAFVSLLHEENLDVLLRDRGLRNIINTVLFLSLSGSGN